jgi:hypothetical protein
MATASPLPPAGASYLQDVLNARDINQYAGSMANMRQAQIAQMQQLAQGAVEKANQERAQKLAEINQNVEALKQKDPRQLNYTAVQANIARDQAIADVEHQRALARAQAFLMDKDSAERYIKDVNTGLSEQYGDALKPFPQQEPFKNAKENWGKLHGKYTTIGSLGEQAKSLKDMINNGDTDRATSYARSVVTKTMNSLISPDALGMTEMMIKFPSLIPAQYQAMLRGASPFNPKDVFLKMTEDYNGDPKEAFFEAFKTHPAEFMKDAFQAYNDEAKNLNKATEDEVINITSPKVAYKEIGARFLPPLESNTMLQDVAGSQQQQGQQGQSQPPRVIPVNPQQALTQPEQQTAPQAEQPAQQQAPAKTSWRILNIPSNPQ